MRLFFAGSTVCICDKTGYAVSDLSGLPDDCASFLPDDHCGWISVTWDIWYAWTLFNNKSGKYPRAFGCDDFPLFFQQYGDYE